MHSFQELDNLLQKTFNNFQKEESTAYLSSKDILQDITEESEEFLSSDLLLRLQERLQLTDIETNIVFILLAPELNSKYARIYAYLQDNMNLTYPTMELLTKLLSSTKEEKQELYYYFMTPSKLILLELIEFDKNNERLLLQQRLKLSSSLRNYLLGDTHLSGTLPSYCALLSPKQVCSTNVEIEQSIEKKMQNSQRFILNLYGATAIEQEEKALEIASYFNFGLLRIDSEMLLQEKLTLSKLLPSLLRDALLTGTLLYFDAFDLLLKSVNYSEKQLINHLNSMAWITLFSTKSKWMIDKKEENFLSFNLKAPREQGSFEDLILPQKQKEELQMLIVHYEQREKVFQEWGYEKFFQAQGISVLFAGASGTGKTLTASILADVLNLELYKIDLSKLVSKYIGETEKHLALLFKKAKEENLMLFFDEADSIFGKRSEVQNAHDRYANIEVSYLLQKIEEYDGIVILASNFKENIDEAFLRRLRFVIDFPTPNAEQRKELWQKLLPLEHLEESIDFTQVAQTFKLSGANIRNIALASAFFAAGEESKISMTHLMKALQNELDKVGIRYDERYFGD